MNVRQSLKKLREVNPPNRKIDGVSSLNVFHRLETGAMSHFDWDTELAASEKFEMGLV